MKISKRQRKVEIVGQTIQWSKNQRTHNDLQNTTQKSRERATRSPMKTDKWNISLVICDTDICDTDIQ